MHCRRNCNELSYTLHEMKRTGEAGDNLLRVAEEFRESPIMRNNPACYKCKLGRLERAKSCLEKAFEAGDPKEIGETRTSGTHGPVAEYCEVLGKLGRRTVTEAVDGFLTTVATVQRKALAEAVAELIEGRKHLAEAKDGKRSKLSPVYAHNVGMWLNEFAGTFPGYAVCDLTKDHLNTYSGNRWIEYTTMHRTLDSIGYQSSIDWSIPRSW